MKISFVIPAYNEEALIGGCLDSVLQEIRASGADAEVIVVNNASTDRTADIARAIPGIRVVDEARKGLPFAREAGYRATSGELIANVDADTILTDMWIPTVLAEFEKDKNLVVLSGPFIYYDLSPIQRRMVYLFYVLGYLLHLFNRYVTHAGAMSQGGNFVVRRSALDKVGGFDTTISFYGEDTDIARRLSRVGRVKWTFALPIKASGRRLQEEGLVRTAWRYTLNHLSILYLKRPFTKEYTDIRVERS